MLNAQSMACVQKINSELATKPEVLIMALARAVAARLWLPSAATNAASEYFATDCTKQVRNIISCVSDAIAFDAQAVVEMTRTLWLIRYKCAYPADIIYDVPGACSEASFLGYGAVISPVQIKFIQDNNTDLIMAQNNFSRIINDLLGMQDVAQEALKAGKK